MALILRAKTIWQIILGMLLLGLGCITYFTNSENWLTAKIQQQTALITKINLLCEELAEYPTCQQNVAPLEKKFAATSSQLFTPFTIPEVITALSLSALQAQVVITTLKPREALQKHGYYYYPFKIELTGQYQQIVNFIHNIKQLNFFVTFGKLVLKTSAQNLSMQTLLIAIQPCSKSQIAGTTKIPAKPIPTSIEPQLRDLFANDTSVQTVTKNLTSWPSSSLTYLGIITVGNKNWGTLSDPNGSIYLVTSGDQIGSTPSRIEAINKNAIQTENAIDDVYK